MTPQDKEIEIDTELADALRWLDAMENNWTINFADIPKYCQFFRAKCAEVDGLIRTYNEHSCMKRAEVAERECDAYKKAKQENDERFMLERDEATRGAYHRGLEDGAKRMENGRIKAESALRECQKERDHQEKLAQDAYSETLAMDKRRRDAETERDEARSQAARYREALESLWRFAWIQVLPNTELDVKVRAALSAPRKEGV